jgi:hypothetical protein
MIAEQMSIAGKSRSHLRAKNILKDAHFSSVMRMTKPEMIKNRFTPMNPTLNKGTL